jgi:three-Cys-motif partner protein
MIDNSFFSEQTEASLVKANIISKYFFSWASVIMGSQDRIGKEKRIGYIDLFAGPGRYEDGSVSTPIMILEKAINDERISSRLVTIFNDKDSDYIKSLEMLIFSIPRINKLKYKPRVINQEIGENIVREFESMNLIPTFFFVDPWGYKGLSLRLVNSVIKNWGCDCVFFFNYNRINMGLSNALFEDHMGALFGKEKVLELKNFLANQNPKNRELLVVEELCQSLKGYGTRFTLPFRFRNKNGTRTSHHLIFVTKNFKGYDIMKNIMWRESTAHDEDNIGSFEYNPADHLPKQSLLFQLDRPLNDLKDQILKDFKGKTITTKELYESHSIDKPYILRNYKDALMELEKENYISVPKHRANTFADGLTITFR